VHNSAWKQGNHFCISSKRGREKSLSLFKCKEIPRNKEAGSNCQLLFGTFQVLYFSIWPFYNRKKEGIFMNTNIISRYLQLLRKKHNYTQDELAKRLDVSRQAVSKWETRASIPDLEVLLKISKLYGITINDILEPNIPAEKITDFEQLLKVPENELREILEQYDTASLVIASMGASPEINNLLEKIFPNVDYKMERNCIGSVRIDEVERKQQEIVSVINLQALDSELL